MSHGGELRPAADPAPARDERRYWLKVGGAAWTAVAAIALADIGLQRVLGGKPFLESWADGVAVMLWVLPGALLSPLLIVLFGRFRAQGRTGVPLGRYVLAGFAYWFAWSVAHAALLQAGLGPPELRLGSWGQELVRALAAHAFTSTVLFAAMVVLFEATVYRRAARDRELRTARLQTEVSRAHTAALAAKLDPHFLFNTIHVASGLMNRDTRAARRVLDDLGALIRDSGRYDGGQLVALGEEIRLVERYLRIQRARFGARLDAEIRIAPPALRCGVPPLLLQPLVENAVQHGIDGNAEPAELRVHGDVVGDELVLQIYNSGSGHTETTPVVERIGLGGVRARLALLFGTAARLDLSRPPAGGFRAVIRMPALDPSAVTEAER